MRGCNCVGGNAKRQDGKRNGQKERKEAKKTH